MGASLLAVAKYIYYFLLQEAEVKPFFGRVAISAIGRYYKGLATIKIQAIEILALISFTLTQF